MIDYIIWSFLEPLNVMIDRFGLSSIRDFLRLVVNRKNNQFFDNSCVHLCRVDGLSDVYGRHF